jgi:hypothetical protein
MSLPFHDMPTGSANGFPDTHFAASPVLETFQIVAA